MVHVIRDIKVSELLDSKVFFEILAFGEHF